MQILAEESILQTLNRLALKKLREFVTLPSKESASALDGSPSIFNITRYEYKRWQAPKPTTLDLFSWLVRRGSDVLGVLLAAAGPVSNDTAGVILEEPWQKV